MKLHCGDVRAVGKPIRLQLVELEHLVQTAVVEVVDLPARQKLLHHDHRVADLGNQLGSRSRIARQP
ncbi:hypothetical protein ACIBJF_08145 [Streptomyces sp. NPDC050743]|uniref:hypothetical protein n=1 Tax=Streptomyces sp. NPDC050743 TaxID=3365634 RepID=UPI0037A38A14